MIRPQYHFRRVDGNIHIWNVAVLLDASKDLPVHTIPLTDIAEIDEPYWYDLGDATPTCRSVLDHARLVEAADLAWPILLCAQGRVMDGMHRIMKAVSEGRTHIAARRLDQTPPPHFIDVPVDDLPY